MKSQHFKRNVQASLYHVYLHGISLEISPTFLWWALQKLLPVRLSVYLSVHLPVCPSGRSFTRTSVLPDVRLSRLPFVQTSVRPDIPSYRHPLVQTSVRPIFNPFVRSFICPSIRLSSRPFVHLSVHLAKSLLVPMGAPGAVVWRSPL